MTLYYFKWLEKGLQHQALQDSWKAQAIYLYKLCWLKIFQISFVGYYNYNNIAKRQKGILAYELQRMAFCLSCLVSEGIYNSSASRKDMLMR